MSAKQVSWLLIACGLLGCKSEAEQQQQERARIRAARLRQEKQRAEADLARRRREAAEEARRRAAAMAGTPGPGDAGTEKPGKRRHRFTFPSWLRVLGGLSRRTVQRVLKRHRGAVSRCVWKGWKAKPPLRGTVRIAFAVALTGKITRLSVEYGKAPHAVTTACLREKILRWKFPRNKREPTLVGVSAVGRRRFTRRFWNRWRR